MTGGLGARDDSTPGLLARVSGAVAIDGVTVLGNEVWTGDVHTVRKTVTRVPGVDTITFDVYQADDSDSGVFYPLLYRE